MKTPNETKTKDYIRCYYCIEDSVYVATFGNGRYSIARNVCRAHRKDPNIIELGYHFQPLDSKLKVME